MSIWGWMTWKWWLERPGLALHPSLWCTFCGWHWDFHGNPSWVQTETFDWNQLNLFEVGLSWSSPSPSVSHSSFPSNTFQSLYQRSSTLFMISVSWGPSNHSCLINRRQTDVWESPWLRRGHTRWTQLDQMGNPDRQEHLGRFHTNSLLALVRFRHETATLLQSVWCSCSPVFEPELANKWHAAEHIIHLLDRNLKHIWARRLESFYRWKLCQSNKILLPISWVPLHF